MELERSENQLISSEVILEDERSGVFGTLRSESLPENIDHRMRSILVDWLIVVKEELKLGVKTLLKGILILDACLCRMPDLARDDFQVLGVACVSLAASYEEIEYPSLHAWVVTADRAYTNKQIEDMRDSVFKLLGCSISMPTQIDFLRIISDHSGSAMETHKLAQNILVTAIIMDTDYLPSVRATVAYYIAHKILASSGFVNVFGIPQEVIEDYAADLVKQFKKLERSTLTAHTKISNRSSKWKEHIAAICNLNYKHTAGDNVKYITGTYFKQSLAIPLLSPDVIPADADYLGEGAFGIVKKVHYKGGDYAVKISTYFEDFALTQSLTREISVMLSLDHPNVMKIYHITSDLTSVFLPLGRSSLYEWIEHNKAYDKANQNDLARQLLSALVYIHRCGVLHRDIKPQNVIVYRENGGLLYKLSDFGSARGCDLALNTGSYTTLICTLWFRSPELLLGDAVYGDRLDVWSMCCMLYYCATGSYLFTGADEVQMLRSIYSIKGKPKASDWPGVSRMPMYNQVYDAWPEKTKFFSSDSQLSPLYKEIMRLGIVLNPDMRASSQDLYDLLGKYE